MRINAGIHKGRRITAPKKLPVRPTTDFAKEGLFNILNNKYDFTSISVLDLFSGTGNISYEFASRGTPEITSVDAHTGCVRFIQATADALDMPITAIRSDVFKFLENSVRTFNLIFADPPYAMESEEFYKLIDRVFEQNLLVEDGLLVIEHSKHTELSNAAQFTDQRRYGGSVFSFFST